MVDSTYLAAIVDTAAAAENHILTEYAGDWGATIETVHPDARYAVVARPGVLKVVQGKDDVATMYNRRTASRSRRPAVWSRRS